MATLTQAIQEDTTTDIKSACSNATTHPHHQHSNEATKSTSLNKTNNITIKENETMSLKEVSSFSVMEGISLQQQQNGTQHQQHQHSTSTSSCCSTSSIENSTTQDDDQHTKEDIISNSNLLSKKIIESLNDSKCNIEKSNGTSKVLIYLIIGIFVVLISYLLMMNIDTAHHVFNLSSGNNLLAKPLLNSLVDAASTTDSHPNAIQKKEKKEFTNGSLSGLYKIEHQGIAKYIKPLEPKTRIIGRREMIHFPQLGVSNLLAKVDSGAKTSCLDVANIRHNKVAKTISFDVVLDRHNRSIVQTILDFPFSNTTKTVMSSNGHVSTRYVLKTIISIGPEFENQVAEFTLVERHKLACPVLIGRNVIRMGGFLVDCNKKFTSGKKQKTVVKEPIHVPDLHDYPIPSPPKKKGKKKKKSEN